MIRVAYYSYWSGGMRKRPSQMQLDCQVVSMHHARKHFDKVHLITDSESVPYFEGFGFDSITTELDALDSAYEQVWSLGKIFAYKIAAERGEPFLHIDYDVFFWENFDKKFFEANLLAQQREVSQYYYYNIPAFIAQCPNLHLLEKHRPDVGYNAGIVGGHDVEFLANYANRALEFVLDPMNRFFWTQCSKLIGDDAFPWKKACVAEQYYMEVCRLEYKKEIQCLTPNTWVHEDECERIGFTHLILAKHNPEIQGKIRLFAQKIKEKAANVSNEPRSKYNLCVGAIFHNEASQLKEWLDHYIKRGVDHFYLINDGSTDDFKKILAPYQEVVTLFNAPERKNYNRRQIDLYNYFFLPVRECARWFLLCDLDEYMWSPRFNSLWAACENLEAEGIQYATIPMVLFGSNNHKQQPESVVQAFTKRSRLDAEYFKFVRGFAQQKPLARGRVIKTFGIHHMEISCADVAHFSPLDDRLRINHYRLQSEERWVARLNLPDVNCFIPPSHHNLDAHASTPVPINSSGNYRTVEMFHEFNKTQNAIEDLELALQN
jgi:hypothetical protein